MNDPSSTSRNSQPPRHRWHIRLFVIAVTIVAVVQSIPSATNADQSEGPLGKAMDLAGLWQRPWSMFAPEPRRTTSWLSADLIASDNRRVEWWSPQWAYVQPAEKFIRFRHLNYYSRFQTPVNPLVVESLADHLRRTEPLNSDVPITPADIRTVTVFLNSKKLLMPDDGTLPNRDETYWMVSNQTLGSQSYKQ